MEALASSRALPVAELKYVYAGAFISFMTETEHRIQELFLGLVMGRISHPRPGVKPLISVKSEAVLRKVLVGDRSFVDWLPYEKSTRKRAPAFLASGEPFQSLPKGQRKALEQASILRNAIAHQSGSARRLFVETFVEGKALPRSEQTPAGYLRGIHAPGQRRINLLFSEVVQAVSYLCAR
jgi:hypothetical protein